MKFVSGIFFILLFEISPGSVSDDVLTLWANRIGRNLWDLGSNLTRHHDLNADFNQANITEIDLATIIEEMATRISGMLERKKEHLRQVVEFMEEGTKTLPDEPNEKIRNEYTFKNAKNLSAELKSRFTRDVNFFSTPVTTNFSTVHVPTDVYDRGNDTLLGIYCSEILDTLFKHSYDTDPTLSWQYFAGASGFMRIFPGTDWTLPEEQADLFDARNRPWYIEAATDPKDIVILVDNSGSMMGQKKKIARHTVNTILETLGPNDFINIFKFEERTDPVTKCFQTSLVQANLVTIRELKFGVENMSKANNLANFTDALNKAFGVLHHHREESLASMCNQAIMLITDGVTDNHVHIFERENWKNGTDPPFPVRIFTYLIGRDNTDSRGTKWMACANQGYYVQLNTIPEVKEQVFNYMNVLARPLVLKSFEKIGWTSLYAHRINPKITDYRWEKQQNDRQKEYTVSFRDDWKAFLNQTAQQKRGENWIKTMLDQNKYVHEEPEFNFMISLSRPAYDKRRKKNITENVLVNEAYWIQRVYEADVATLLGVAGTDVPISEFKKMMKPYYLGVNNYGFIVNNNGYIIVHPDHRPFFRGTLKPGYNSVDMLEVELLDNGDENKDPRDFDIKVDVKANGETAYMLSNLSLLRDLVINQTDNSSLSFQVKYHYDNMKRASTGKRHYHIRKIDESPLTLVLTTMRPPCNGSHCLVARVVAPNMEKRPIVSSQQINELFSGNWTIHPEWFYCKYNYLNEFYKEYSENIGIKTLELLHFVKKMNVDKFWDESKDPYAAEIKDPDVEPKIPLHVEPTDKKFFNIEKKFSPHNAEKMRNDPNSPLLTYSCDQELIRNLLFDANITKNIFRHLDYEFKSTPALNFSENSIKNVFVSTHSGLTRWKDLRNDTSFGYVHNRAIEEVWYTRAVQQYYVNKESFVFSVPLDQEYSDKLLVTASHAIFVKEKRKRADEALQAPAAVVGFQFAHSDFDRYVRSVIDNTGTRRNSHEGMSYFVLDNNGYIMAANDSAHVGKFFGAVNPDLMHSFQECRIFRKIVIYDYQGVCFYQEKMTSAAFSTLINFQPFKQIGGLLKWLVGTLILGVLRINLEILVVGLITPFRATLIVKDDDESVENIEIQNFDDEFTIEAPYRPKYGRVKHMVVLNRTRPQTCDRAINLYNLQPEKMWDSKCVNMTKILRPIPHTNLLLVMLPNVTEKVDKSKTMNTDPFRIRTLQYSSPVCYKIDAVLSRRRPSTCCKNDKDEKRIALCGNGNPLIFSSLTLLSSLFLLCWQFLL